MNPAPSSVDRHASPGPTWVRWRIVALLVAFSFMTWFNRVSMSVAYDEKIKNELGISEEAMGMVYSAFLAAYTLCMTPGGWLIDRFGPKLALVVMGFGSGVFCALTGLAGMPALAAAGMALPAFFLIRSIMGVLSAPVYPGASRAVSFWVPRGARSLANGLIQSGAALGIAFVFPVFGALMDSLGWPSAFLVSGSVTIVLALAWTLYATDDPAQHPGVNEAELHRIGPSRLGINDIDAESATPDNASDISGFSPQRARDNPNWAHLFLNRSLMLLTISYGALSYLEYLFFFWMHYYFDDVLHLGKEQSRAYAMILFVAFAAGMILGGWVTDRIESILGHGKGRAVVPIVGMSAGALFLWQGLLHQEVHWIVISLALALAGVGAVEAAVWPTAVDLGGRHGGMSAGICNTGGNLGGLVAPVLTPFLSHEVMALFGVSEQQGWQWGIALGGLICLMGAILWLWIDPAER